MKKRYVHSSARFSHDRVYRFRLTRVWSGSLSIRYAMFIGLNPSTANETEDDPTIRRCVSFARDWGYDGLHMCNLFAYRSSDPKKLLEVGDPHGPGNQECSLATAKRSDTGIVVAAWGASGGFKQVGSALAKFLFRNGIRVYHLGMTKKGYPRHPLYLPKTTRPQIWM